MGYTARGWAVRVFCNGLLHLELAPMDMGSVKA